jgi:hypothetical protein
LKKLTAEDFNQPLSKKEERQIRRLFQRVANFVKQNGKILTRQTGSIVFNQRWEFRKHGLHILYYQGAPSSSDRYCGARVWWNQHPLFEAFGRLAGSSLEKIHIRALRPGKWQKRIITRARNRTS